LNKFFKPGGGGHFMTQYYSDVVCGLLL